MWNLLRFISRNEPEFAQNILELLAATQRNIVYTTCGLALAWLFIITTGAPGVYVLDTFPLMVLIVLLAGLLVWILEHGSLLTAQVVLQVGLAGLITYGLVTFRVAEVVLCLMLLPLIASVTIGWWFAVIVEGGVAGLMFWLSNTPLLPPMPHHYAWIVPAGGLTLGLLGWAATHALLTLTQWALRSYHSSQVHVSEARSQREELFQVRDDLILANRELARLSNRLKVMTQAAEEARRVKEEFVANVSHELRTPLNMVIGFCEVIADSPRVYGQLPPALMADIAAIQRNGQHLAALVNDVLDLSQIEAGRMALSKDWTTLEEILAVSVGAVQALYDSKGLYLQLEIPPEPVKLFCDSIRVREVILNLLSNAGRFTEKGGVKIHVELNQNRDLLIFSVEDTGPGISKENLGRLFEPFQQLDNSIRRREGTGLGLSISKRFVEMHGGKMWVESQPGQGTTFYFSLPVGLALPEAPETGSVRRWVNPFFSFEKTIRRSKAPAPVWAPRFVLLDQGSSVSRLLRRYLEGVEVVHMRDVASALAELARSPAQALIVNRLSFDGRPDLLESLVDLPFGTPLIECWVPGDDEASRRLGVRRYLTKPVKKDDLLHAIRAVGESVHTLLVVDDQPEMLQLFGRMLGSAEDGYSVIRARNGQHALDLLRQRRPDVMLLDLVMPDLDGFAVLREKSLDESIRDIPVIVVSSNDPSGTPIISDHLGIHLSSGFSAREFIACVRAVSEVLSPKALPDDRVPLADSAA